jgi:hypothetical protein
VSWGRVSCFAVRRGRFACIQSLIICAFVDKYNDVEWLWKATVYILMSKPYAWRFASTWIYEHFHALI